MSRTETNASCLPLQTPLNSSTAVWVYVIICYRLGIIRIFYLRPPPPSRPMGATLSLKP